MTARAILDGPAIVSEPDPILVAIETHRAARQVLEDACKAEARFPEALHAAFQDGANRTITDAFEALCSTDITTAEGLSAFVRHIHSMSDPTVPLAFMLDHDELMIAVHVIDRALPRFLAVQDPVFAAIGAFRRADEKLEERRAELQAEGAPPQEADERERPEFDARMRALALAYQTRPTTQAGYRALLDLLIVEDAESLTAGADDAQMAAFNLLRWGRDVLSG